MNVHRYAIYFAPPAGSQLETLGSNWLGRDAHMGNLLTPHLPESIPEETWRLATQAPRRYGFHATLKPPFRLAAGQSGDSLKAALALFAKSQQAFELPRLTLGKLGRFLALILSEPSPALQTLAADCVREFDAFRAPSDPEDIARRMQPSLNEAERANLLAWGYPYVLDTWKFHMTLTNSLAPETLAVFHSHLAERFQPTCEQPLLCDAVCLFEEPSPNSALLLTDRFELAR